MFTLIGILFVIGVMIYAFVCVSFALMIPVIKFVIMILGIITLVKMFTKKEVY